VLRALFSDFGDSLHFRYIRATIYPGIIVCCVAISFFANLGNIEILIKVNATKYTCCMEVERMHTMNSSGVFLKFCLQWINM